MRGQTAGSSCCFDPSHFPSLILCVLVLNHAAAQTAAATPKKPSVWDSAHRTYIHTDPPGKAAIQGVTHHILHSAKMQRGVGFNILLSDDYAISGKRYPGVHALHGATGHEGTRPPCGTCGKTRHASKAARASSSA